MEAIRVQDSTRIAKSIEREKIRIEKAKDSAIKAGNYDSTSAVFRKLNTIKIEKSVKSVPSQNNSKNLKPRHVTDALPPEKTKGVIKKETLPKNN